MDVPPQISLQIRFISLQLDSSNYKINLPIYITHYILSPKIHPYQRTVTQNILIEKSTNP